MARLIAGLARIVRDVGLAAHPERAASTRRGLMAAALLDVDALIALAWDSHVHHARVRGWFADNSATGWATCPITESGFVRVSSNPKILPSAIGVDAARGVLSALRAANATASSLTMYRSPMATCRP